MVAVIDTLLILALVYVVMGLLFSVYFYTKGAARIDEGTEGTPWHFKLIIFPGVVLFWSVLLVKSLKSS